MSQLTSDINWGTAALFCESIQSCFTVNQHLFFTRDDIISQFTNKINWFAMITFWSNPYPGSCCYYDHNSRACSRQEIFTMLLDWYAYYHT